MYENGSFAEGYAIGRDSGSSNDGMFGGGSWAWWIIILLIFGYNGFGGFGGFGQGGAGLMSGYATQADIQRGFDTNGIMNKLNGLENGICDGFYAVNTSLLNGFAGVNSAVVNSGYETRSAINNLSAQLAQCCCQTQNAIQGVNYNLATQACAINTGIANAARDIIDSQRDGTAQILNYLTTEKIDSLNRQLSIAQGQLSQNAQTTQLLSAINRTPVPAYVVANPYCCSPYTAGACSSACSSVM